MVISVYVVVRSGDVERSRAQPFQQNRYVTPARIPKNLGVALHNALVCANSSTFTMADLRSSEGDKGSVKMLDYLEALAPNNSCIIVVLDLTATRNRATSLRVNSRR